MYFELGAAIADHKRIIPILVEDVEIELIPQFLRRLQFLRPASPTEAGKRVAEVIERKTA
jgi:hypothetical protein